MHVQEFIPSGSVVTNLKPNSKRQLLQELAIFAAARSGQAERTIFETLLQRERLGSTGVGKGVAIPHGRIAGLDRIHGIFARLAKPIDFDAIDDMPVDLVCVLLAPEGSGAEHLKALSRVARLLRDEHRIERLRDSGTPDALYTILTEERSADAA